MRATTRPTSAPPPFCRANAVPPRLRRWWLGLPRLALQETAAFLLPSLLPLRPSDRLLLVGASMQALPAALQSRIPLETTPIGFDWEPGPARLAGTGGVALARAHPSALPFRDAYFTIVVVGHQIRAWDDALLLRFLSETWRVLTHNGIVVLWEVAPSRSARINAIWGRLLAGGAHPVRLRSFAEIGGLGREAGFAWLQTLRLRPFLWPPGPRITVMMRKERYDAETVKLEPGATPLYAPDRPARDDSAP